MNYANCLIAPRDMEQVWLTIPAINHLKKSGRLVVVASPDVKPLFEILFPSVTFILPDEKADCETMYMSAGDLCSSRVQAAKTVTPIYGNGSHKDPCHSHLAIMCLRNVSGDIWKPDYSCEYQPRFKMYKNRMGLNARDFLDMLWSDNIPADKYSYISHIKALFGKPQVVVWPGHKSLFMYRPLNKHTHIIMGKCQKGLAGYWCSNKCSDNPECEL